MSTYVGAPEHGAVLPAERRHERDEVVATAGGRKQLALPPRGDERVVELGQVDGEFPARAAVQEVDGVAQHVDDAGRDERRDYPVHVGGVARVAIATKPEI